MLERILEPGSGEVDRLNYVFENREASSSRYYLENLFGRGIRQPLVRQLNNLMDSSSTADEFRNNLSVLGADTREKVEALEHRETQETMGAFAGATKSAILHPIKT